MKLIAYLLAQSAIDAVFIVYYWIEEALAVGLHGDAVLGAFHRAG